jgi:hypothetical protein
MQAVEAAATTEITPRRREEESTPTRTNMVRSGVHGLCQPHGRGEMPKKTDEIVPATPNW